jgi:4'-phosphopantetheinyl transferase
MLKIFTHKANNKKNNKQLKILSEKEREKAMEFRSVKDRNLYIAGKYLTRKAIGLHFKIKPDSIIFKADKYGRPSLFYPKIKNFDFNLSHSGNTVVLAIADSEVGIDIEKIKPVELKIARNYFHKEEINFLYSKKGKELENFYKIWTLKESFIKTIGKGLSFPLKSFYFEFKRGNDIKINPKSKWGEWHFKSYNISHKYKMAVCIKKVIG